MQLFFFFFSFFQQDLKCLAVDSGLSPGEDGECTGQSAYKIQFSKWSTRATEGEIYR